MVLYFLFGNKKNKGYLVISPLTIFFTQLIKCSSIDRLCPASLPTTLYLLSFHEMTSISTSHHASPVYHSFSASSYILDFF